MALNKLGVKELAKVADFFLKDVEVGNPEKGPTKKELLAALASDDGQGPVSWEDYETTYLAANPPEAKPVNEEKAEAKKPTIPSPDDPDDDEEVVLIMYTGKNPTWPALGLTFTKRHPFHSIALEKAEWLVRNQSDRFRVALPSEVKDYYN